MAAQQAVDELAQAADEVLDKIDKKPVLKQILIGAVSGLATGYVMTKIGKSVAFCIGVSAIGMQFLVKRRKTPADWKKVGSDAREALEKILPADRQKGKIRGGVVSLLRENQVFFGSFGGGFLIGLSFA